MAARQADDLPIELLLDAHALVGEGPVWDATSATLVWVDIMGNTVHRFDPATGQDRAIDVGQPVGAAVLRQDGDGLMLAVRDGFGRLDERSGQMELVAPVEADLPNRMNDGKCDPGGRFWAGTMGLIELTPGVAGLYRLDANLQVTRMLSGVTLSNGLGWRADGRQLYYIDSMTRGLDVFDFDPVDGSLGERRRLITIPPDEGLPDGMTVDAEGGLWIALHGSGTIRRYLPDGRLDRVIRVPPTMVTCCAFGGPDLTDLYITSMCLGQTPAERQKDPQAGGLFRCRPGIQGLLPHRFAQ